MPNVFFTLYRSSLLCYVDNRDGIGSAFDQTEPVRLEIFQKVDRLRSVRLKIFKNSVGYRRLGWKEFI